ncbi:MAG: glycosyltransferase family 2 protein [Candidatus Ornithomonoglobus sp.]
MNNVKVSVICTAYNHEKYIKRALDSFVNQKTDFQYEVIVHDDASTDKTADIIKEYERKYPNIIKGIYQKENQYSKGIKIYSTYILPKVIGKYIARCEGDDYWTDDSKLQTQYNIMEKNKNVDVCSHYAKWIDLSGKTKGGFFPNKKFELTEGIVESNKKMKIAVTDLFHLNTLCIRREFYSEYFSNKPEYAKAMPNGDVALLIYIAEKANLYFIDKEMSVYNRGTEGSWTDRVKNNREKFLIHNRKYLKAIKLAYDFVSDENKPLIRKMTIKSEANIYILEEKYRSLINPKYWRAFIDYPIKLKIKVLLGIIMPSAIKWLKNNKKEG